MDVSVLALALALVLAFRVWNLPGRLAALQEELAGRKAEQNRLQAELHGLRDQLAELLEASRLATPVAIVATPVTPPRAAPVWRPAAATVVAPPQVVPAPPAPETTPAPEPVLPLEPVFVAPAVVAVEPVAEAEPISEPVLAAEIAPVAEPASTVELTSEPELVPELAFAPVPMLAIEPEPIAEAESTTAVELLAEVTPANEPVTEAIPNTEPVAEVTLATEPALEPASTATPAPPQAEPTHSPAPVAEPELVAEPEPVWVPAPRQAVPPTPPPPRKPTLPRRPAPKPVPTGPTWWERASTMLLENWTGILGAIVLVTGVGFLGIYTALRVAPPLRFLMICAFAGGLLGARYALRAKPFAKKLNAWLVSSAAAIFLFACVGAVSIVGLRWATPPFDYLLLLAGVSANLYLAWSTSREEVATLHGVLSLVALAVLPPTALTLGAAAGVTAFSIAITYRQLWKYQLLLSIASFFAFHLYWHQELAVISNPLRLKAMALVLLVGGAAAVVQYRSVYARRRFEPLLFTAHLLNWTCLGVNLYLYSTGSVWKTIPLALGAVLTFWAGRRAKQLGIGWLFQTDTIISLILALATALSLQGWHATPTIIGLFMLLEALLITLIMARQREALVYRVALAAALLAGAGVLVLAGTHWVGSSPAQLYREVLVLALAGWAGLAFVQFILKQPLLQLPNSRHITNESDSLRIDNYHSHRSLLNVFAGLTGLLQLGAGLGLARILFGWSNAPVGLLLLGLAGAALALAVWTRRAGRAPSWVRWQQLVLAQFFVLLALLGLHEAGLNWSAVLLLLYAENLLVVLLLAGRAEHDWLHQHLYRAALAAAALAGLSVLLRASSCLPSNSITTLYREALVLALAGWATLAFVQAAFKWPLLAAVTPYLPRLNGEADGSFSRRLVSNHEAHFSLLNGFAGLGGVLQAAGAVVLGRLLFGVAGIPVAALLGALAMQAIISLGLAFWVRKVGNAPGWVRWQQLVLAQVFALLTLLGLHKLGLNWSIVLFLLYAENLLVVLLLAGRAERDWLHQHLYRAALAVAALAGLSVLLRASQYLPGHSVTTLYREALVLALAGWATLAFVQAAFKWPLLAAIKPYLPRLNGEADGAYHLVSNHEAYFSALNSFAGLGGILQAVGAAVLARLLFGVPGVPVATLLGALAMQAIISIGLAWWVRRAGNVPGWVRWQQLVLAQVFALLALLGLHRLGLNWSATLLLVYLETLLIALLLAGRATHDLLHHQLYRGALAEAALAGLLVLLRASSYLAHSTPIALYREALVLALAGWASLGFVQAAFKWRLLAGIKPYLPRFANASSALGGFVSNAEEQRSLVSAFAGLGGVLQALAGVALARVVFGWSAQPVAGLLGLLLGLAGISLGLAAWVRVAGRAPGWVRWQQLVLAQFFVLLALFGLHELGLQWSTVLFVVFAENLLVALLLAGRAEYDLLHQHIYRAALAEALLMGISLLLLVATHIAGSGLAVLYREILLLALAGWATLAFAQATLKWPLLTSIKPYLLRFGPNEPSDFSSKQVAVSNPEAHRDLLGGFAGLAGIFQAEAGLVLGRIVFGWANVPVVGLLLALLALAGAALGLAIWVRTSGQLPNWVRRQQLILAQGLAVLAVFGLHELGLSWPGILCVLYAENLLVALLLSGRDEDGLLHTQTYLLVLQAAVLPLLVRYTSLGALSPQVRALLLVGAALLTLGYQARRRYWRRAQDDFASLSLGMNSSLPVLGLAVGWLLLGAGSLVYAQPWAAWPAMALLGALLYLRQRLALPGLWAGLMVAATGYVALQWGHALHPLVSTQPAFGAGYVLLYLLPTLAVPVAGLLTSWWPDGERYVRWPWLYMLAAHLVVALVAAVPAGHVAYLLLGLLALGTMAFGAALIWRRTLPEEAAVLRAGQPDRYLLHLSYAGLAASLLLHIYLIVKPELLLGISADYLTAGLLVAVLAALALARPPATEPIYASWRRLHPILAEVALLVGSGTLAHNVRAQWLPLAWVGIALALGAATPWLALRFRRLGIYGRLYYWLAAFTASIDCVLYITPSHLLSAEWWGLSAAIVLLFGYVGLALRQGNAPFAVLSPAWQALALPGRRQLEAWLLYPAFLALALLLIQSFDRSVLTVLLMLQVVAVFSTSLLLRRQDLRYVSLAGMLGCMGRLLFFDLRQSGTVTRAVVFILMGLLLLGMNALYARFKARFADPNAPVEPDDETESEADDEAEEPQVVLP